jgi:tetratricopeptide (TPR) repeat protein
MNVNFILADIYYRQKQYTMSLKYYNICLRIDKNVGIIQNSTGLLYYEQKLYDLALRHMENAIELEPDNLWLYNEIAIVEKAEGEWNGQ